MNPHGSDLHPAATCGMIPDCHVALLERAHLIGAHHLAGEWWIVAEQLLTLRQELPRSGSWSQVLAEIPMSRTHAWRLCLIARHGLARPGMGYSVALRTAVGYIRGEIST